MLGEIINGLTNAATAEKVAVAVGRPEILERIRRAAEADGGRLVRWLPPRCGTWSSRAARISGSIS